MPSHYRCAHKLAVHIYFAQCHNTDYSYLAYTKWEIGRLGTSNGTVTSHLVFDEQRRRWIELTSACHF